MGKITGNALNYLPINIEITDEMISNKKRVLYNALLNIPNKEVASILYYEIKRGYGEDIFDEFIDVFSEKSKNTDLNEKKDLDVLTEKDIPYFDMMNGKQDADLKKIEEIERQNIITKNDSTRRTVPCRCKCKNHQ